MILVERINRTEMWEAIYVRAVARGMSKKRATSLADSFISWWNAQYVRAG